MTDSAFVRRAFLRAVERRNGGLPAHLREYDQVVRRAAVEFALVLIGFLAFALIVSAWR